MTDNIRKHLKDWAWFALQNVGCIWLLYQWIYKHDDGALNLLMIVFLLFSVIRLFFVFLKIESKENRRVSVALQSVLFVIYGALMAYHGATITGAVMIVSELLCEAKRRLIREGK